MGMGREMGMRLDEGERGEGRVVFGLLRLGYCVWIIFYLVLTLFFAMARRI